MAGETLLPNDEAASVGEQLRFLNRAVRDLQGAPPVRLPTNEPAFDPSALITTSSTSYVQTWTTHLGVVTPGALWWRSQVTVPSGTFEARLRDGLGNVTSSIVCSAPFTIVEWKWAPGWTLGIAGFSAWLEVRRLTGVATATCYSPDITSQIDPATVGVTPTGL